MLEEDDNNFENHYGIVHRKRTAVSKVIEKLTRAFKDSELLIKFYFIYYICFILLSEN